MIAFCDCGSRLFDEMLRRDLETRGRTFQCVDKSVDAPSLTAWRMRTCSCTLSSVRN
jgi:hypothetical protein